MTDLRDEPLWGTTDADYRHRARQLAMQFLYQLAAQKGENLSQIDTFLAEFCDDEATAQLAKDWSLGTWRNLTRVDEQIGAVNLERQVQRIDLVDLSNLRLGVYQLLCCADVPVKVAINEAVELAKQFSTAQAPAFVNGVLDAVRKHITAEKETTNEKL